MAKALRKAAWDRYLKARTKGAKTKGTPLVAWGWISVDLDRLDTALFNLYLEENLLKWEV